MIVVVDTNIVFSGILTPKGTISDLLLNSSNAFDFYAPVAIMDELETHYQKLLKLSGYSAGNLDFLIRTIMKKIDLVDLESIRPSTWEKAFDLVKDVDEFDTPFIALSLELDSPLWSGDKKLAKGLEQKGVNWVVPTETIKKIRDKE